MPDLSSSTNPLVLFAIALVALLYSSVGHGGASGYLAILTILSVPKAIAASTALMLNVMVASTSAISYYRAKFLNLKTTSMYLAGSVPAAFLGGMAKLPSNLYETVLFVSLAAAAVRLAIPLKEQNVELRPPKFWMAALAGAIIGLVSGMVGIGGGIFLSPVIVLARWDTPKHASGTAALFIVINSISGIVGRLISHTFEVNGDWTFVVAAFIGGIIGSHIGANLFSQITLKRVLAGVLGIACLKLVLP